MTPFAIDAALAAHNTPQARALHPLFDEIMTANRRAAERARRLGEDLLAKQFESVARSTDHNGAHWLRVLARREEATTQRMERETSE